jgi:hypothetical protein
MIDELAQALCEDSQMMWRSVARAALSAMENPTPAMCNSAPALPAICAVDDLPLRDMGYTMAGIMNRKRFVAMIQTAKGEGHEPHRA